MTAGREEEGVASGQSLRLLVVQALGVVYGDIATSPLYAFRTCFAETSRIAPTPEHVLGILSLILWSLLLLISLKYAAVVLRADLRGEGGILALMTLVTAGGGDRRGNGTPWLVMVGLFGAALLYGDGMITPAMSVLSAIEGLKIAAPQLHEAIVPLTVLILIGLFALQHRGSGPVGSLFGPVMILWFAALVVLGLHSLIVTPQALAAINPLWGIRFLAESPRVAFVALGSVFLAVTGAEAMYADLGHFGRRPIQVAWFALVLPALLINYFGQGALALRDPGAANQSFYRLAPEWAVFPLIGLAAAATVVASQAIISGAFSLTYQAVQLGFLPRVNVRHYSPEGEGKVYLPFVNGALLGAAVLLVLGFRSSDHLAGAYGVAVSGTMVITSILLFFCFRRIWGWNALGAAALAGAFLSVELIFLSANLAKVPDGGWVPLASALAVFLTMTTWRQGRELIDRRVREGLTRIEDFIRTHATAAQARVPGTAVYVTREPSGVPWALASNLKHNKVLHEQIVLLTIRIEAVPRVAALKRLSLEQLDAGFLRVIARYGFIQPPSVMVLLREMQKAGVRFAEDDLAFFATRNRFVYSDSRDMAQWRKHYFALLARNTPSAVREYRIPGDQLFELGITFKL